MASNFNFGIVFSIFFFILSIYFYYAQKLSFSLMFGLLFFIFLILSLLVPRSLYYFNLGWYKLSKLLSIIISPIILGIIFFIIITPLSFFFKIIGRDELHLKNKKISSYWIKRGNPKTEEDFFRNQY